jgi:hypothetical protein
MSRPRAEHKALRRVSTTSESVVIQAGGAAVMAVRIEYLRARKLT